MNKTLIIAVAAVVILGGGYWYFTSQSGRMMGESASVGQTFAALMTGGQNVECTFEQSDGGSATRGTIFMADRGERIRGDFTITGATPMEAHMIRDGGWNYIWSSMMPQGIKMQVTAENKGKLFDTDSASVPDDVQYRCSSWGVDGSKFALPGNVTFMDLSAQMEASQKMMEGVQGMPQGGSGDMKAMQCAACDQVPGEGRDQCRIALGCE